MSFEKGGTITLAWKRRDGLGGRLAGKDKKWEQRWIVLADGQIRYYGRGDEDKFGQADFQARGKIDLLETKCTVSVSSSPSPDAPTPHEVDIVSEAPDADIMKQQHNPVVPAKNAAAAKKGVVVKWKLCFETQQDLMEFLEKAHAVLDETGQLVEKDAGRFEHDFLPADHIYRWEMIVCPPVIYPIQIHGIVLEAGRNCVVVADFGLTGYGKKSASDEFHHASDDDYKEHNQIVAAFKKLRPNSDQRLHITTLTDPMDIRKWTKAHYDEQSFLAPDKLKRITQVASKLLGQNLKRHANNATAADTDDDEHPDHSENSNDNSNDNSQQQPPNNRRRAFSEDYARQRQEEHPLPKADPKEIVLDRANFLLEFGEDKLPPYHVFFSNSECIAVWCKTGRWSTLQTAVFLSSNAIGGAKSATVATLGVAAAHAILAPVVAVGGLLWVTAPMVILKKSREKWEENTMKMTDLYWQEWAPPSIYVCAIEHWSEVGYSSASASSARAARSKTIKAPPALMNAAAATTTTSADQDNTNDDESAQQQDQSSNDNENNSKDDKELSSNGRDRDTTNIGEPVRVEPQKQQQKPTATVEKNSNGRGPFSRIFSSLSAETAGSTASA